MLAVGADGIVYIFFSRFSLELTVLAVDAGGII